MKLHITLTKSPIARLEKQIRTIEALGLRKIGQTVVKEDNPCVRGTYLLLDECHRWNKAQSDSILPAIESGDIRFIGSTTENPMIAMTPAILSRCRLFEPDL